MAGGHYVHVLQELSGVLFVSEVAQTAGLNCPNSLDNLNRRTFSLLGQ